MVQQPRGRGRTRSAEIPGWRIADDKLFFRKLHTVKSQTVGDLERWKLIVPRETREIIRENYDPPHAGHLGIEKTYHCVATRYYWLRMFGDMAEYVRRCDVCQQTRSSKMSRQD